jgi:hypothetical protein
MGSGDGTFQPVAIYYSHATVVSAVAVADVNGDGKPDILVGGSSYSSICATGGLISILLNDGDGKFRQGGCFASTSGAGALAVADLNGDGKLDVVSVGGSIGVMLGNGDGTFQAQVAYNSGGEGADGVVIADVNEDGKPDLVVSNQNVSLLSAEGGVGVLFGNGDGTFQAAVSYDAGGMQANSVAVADLNGDHHPDIVVTTFSAANAHNNDYADGSVGVLIGNGDGTFQPVVSYYPGGGQTYAVAVADLNGDSKPDLVIANAYEGRGSNSSDNNVLGVLLGSGDGTFHPVTSYATGGFVAPSAIIADVNGDGKPDVLMTAGYSGGSAVVSVVLGNRDGSFRAPVIYSSTVSGDNTIVAVDVNGDGTLDLVIAGESVSCTGCAGGVGVLLNRGHGTFQSPVSYGTGTTNPTYSVAVADVNGDGKPDIIATSSCISNSSCVSSVAVLLNNGNGTFKAALNYPTMGQAAHAVTVGDVNGDGKPDIVVANSCATGDLYCTSGTMGVLLGNGDGTFRTVVSYPSGGQNPTSVALGDLNRDGRVDIVVSNYQTTGTDFSGHIGVLLGNGDGTFQPAVVYLSGGLGNNSVAIADLDRDGKPDLVAVNQAATTGSSAGTLGVLLGNGDGTFRPAIVTATTKLSIDYFAQTAIADFNGDGKLDVACGSSDFLLLGNGDGTFQPVLPLGFSGVGIAAGDFNGDGRPDLAVGGVAILLNKSSGFGESTTTSLISSVTPSFINQPVTFTATITSTYGPIPNGETVSFYDGAILLGTGATTNGVATFTTSDLAARIHSIKATYPGDVTFKASSGTGTQRVTLYPSSTSLPISSLNPSTYGQSVTLVVTVTSMAPTAPTGSVAFKCGTTVIGYVPLNSSGVASLTRKNLPASALSITAAYGGDSETAKSTSPALLQTVYQASSATTLKSSLNPATVGQSVTFTVTVKSPTTTPTGTVTFMDGSNVLGNIILCANQASYTTSALTAGSHSITAIYGGTVNIKGSASSVVKQLVN